MKLLTLQIYDLSLSNSRLLEFTAKIMFQIKLAFDLNSSSREIQQAFFQRPAAYYFFLPFLLGLCSHTVTGFLNETHDKVWYLVG